MGRKSRLKRLRRTLAPSPELEPLLSAYLVARAELAEGANVAVFQGQLVNGETLSELYFSEGERLGLSRTQLLTSLVVEMNLDEP